MGYEHGDRITKRMVRRLVRLDLVRDLGVVAGCRSFVVVDLELRERWFGRQIYAVAVFDWAVFASTHRWRDRGVRVHERHHVKQARRYGRAFELLYLVLHVVFGYRLHPFELGARLATWRDRRRR